MSPSTFLPQSNMRKTALLLALAAPIFSNLVACTSNSRPPVQASQPAVERKKPPEPCPGTENSRRLAGLIDQGSFNASEGLFQRLLRDHPDDSRLHIEYIRYLLLTSNPAYPGNIASPIIPDERYWVVDVASEAARRGGQLNPDCKPIVASTIHEALITRIRKTLQAGEGIIGEPGSFYYPRPNSNAIQSGLSSSILQLGWVALEASPRTSAEVLDRYRQLMELAVEKGKVASAAMIGNLLGDLEHGDTTGDLDFEYACDAFARALNQHKPDPNADWIQHTIDIFRDVFRADLDRYAAGSGPEAMMRLEQQLRSRGYSLIGSADPSFGLQGGPTGGSPHSP
jgi:hypothetical protein